MSSDNFRLCPFCKMGELRVRRRVVEGEAKKPFWQRTESNQLVCEACGHVIRDNQLVERFFITGSASAKAVTKDSREKSLTKEKTCSSCHEQKNIVFARGDFKLCKECLDKVREQHNLEKGI
jgi:hypothetical protein